jgi:nucleotide-binding universal stress UspA family protein
MDSKYGPAYALTGKVVSEPSSLAVKMHDNDESKNASDDEEKVVVVKPKKTEYKASQEEGYNSIKAEGEVHQRQPNSDEARGKREGGGQSFKDVVVPTDKLEAGGGSSSLASQAEPSESKVQYNRILVPHDGSDISDKALNHAIYLSKMCDAEIVILHIVEHMDKVSSSAVTATSKEGVRGPKDTEKSNRSEELFDITIEGEVKNMIEEKMRFCKQAGVKSQLSYKIQTGKPVEEIVRSAEDMNVDLIVMASTRSSSLAKRILGSTSKKVLDGVKRPTLIVHV